MSCHVSDYLEDGYTAKAGIAPVDGVHNGIAIEWRPCLAADTSRVMDAKTDAAYIDAIVGLVAEKLLRWNLKNSRGEVVPITKENVGRVRRRLLDPIANAVIFGDLPDGTKVDVEADLKN